jgi:hypothetical protein
MAIVAERETQRKISDTSTDKTLLLLLLEKLLVLIGRLWRDEVKANRSDIETPRQVVLRKVHQALGEWFELETRNKEAYL